MQCSDFFRHETESIHRREENTTTFRSTIKQWQLKAQGPTKKKKQSRHKISNQVATYTTIAFTSYERKKLCIALSQGALHIFESP